MFLLILIYDFPLNRQSNTLHSTMFLLIQDVLFEPEEKKATLHSTMFLLIPVSALVSVVGAAFTFHDVSINTVFATLILLKILLYIPRCFY